jgi:hypothetical protein
MRHNSIVGSVAIVLALALATPAAANEAVRWTDIHDISNVFTCGVVEGTTATIEGTAYFDAEGNWLKDVLRFSYEASYTDPSTSRTIDYTTRQIITAEPGTISLMGQGLFVRAAGGAVQLDVGRLVFDPADGSTVFKSAQTLAFDDPTVPDRYDAAICSLF